MIPIELRTFHLTGKGLDALRPSGPLHPAALDEIELPRFERNYPLLVAGAEPARPLFAVTQDEALAAAAAQRMEGRISMPADAALENSLSVPKDAWLAGFGRWTPVLLACAALESARRAPRESFLKELREHAQRLEELLAADSRNSPAAASAHSVAAALGERAKSLLDPSAWADALGRRAQATHAMETARRGRCAAALAAIRDQIASMEKLPAVIVIHSDGRPESAPSFAIEFREAGHESVCDYASGVYREMWKHFVPAWRALRTARLELDGVFDPLEHPAALEGFDWTMARAQELAALPAVVAFASASEIAGSLTAFSSLLRSGLPAQIVIECPDGMDENLACLPLCYQDAFALSSSIGCPAHLARGIWEMAGALRPAAALVAVSDSWTQAALVPMTRAWPLYRYDPGRGESWRERFAFDASRAVHHETLSFAHAAALAPAFRDHFRVEDGPDSSFALAAPHILVRNGNGGTRVAVFTRELAHRSASAEQTWRMLAELAAPGAPGVPDPAALDRARLDGAAQAIQQAISMLANPEGLA